MLKFVFLCSVNIEHTFMFYGANVVRYFAYLQIFLVLFFQNFKNLTLTIMTTFKQRLKKVIDDKNITCSGLERTLNLSTGVISKVISGTSIDFRVSNLLKIANLYKDIDMNWLVGSYFSLENSENKQQKNEDSHENNEDYFADLLRIIENQQKIIEHNMTIIDRLSTKTNYIAIAAEI